MVTSNVPRQPGAPTADELAVINFVAETLRQRPMDTYESSENKFNEINIAQNNFSPDSHNYSAMMKIKNFALSGQRSTARCSAANENGKIASERRAAVAVKVDES